MRNDHGPRTTIAGLPALALAAALAAGPPGEAEATAGAAPAPRASETAARAPVPAPVERITATVGALDLAAGTVDLVTGVGHALRVRRVALPPGLRVRVGDRESPPSVLVPGCVVRVECGHAAGVTVASSVILLRGLAPGRTP